MKKTTVLMYTPKQLSKLALVVLSGCILSGVLIELAKQEPSIFMKTLLRGVGPFLTAWSVFQMIVKWKKPPES